MASGDTDQDFGSRIDGAQSETTIPDIPCRFVKASGETPESFVALAGKTFIDTDGVACCLNLDTGNITRIAAFMLDDERNARQIRLRKNERTGQLEIPVPAGLSPRFGLFVGHYSPDHEFCAVARASGRPLYTAAVNDGQNQELMEGLDGLPTPKTRIADDDVSDEQKWATQIELFTFLHFKPTQTSAIVARRHSLTPVSGGSETTWNVSALRAVPLAEMGHIAHFDTSADRLSELTVRVYGTQDPYDDLYDFGTLRGGTRGGMFGGQTRGLGIGFDPAVRETGRTRSVTLGNLEGAYRFRIVEE